MKEITLLLPSTNKVAIDHISDVDLPDPAIAFVTVQFNKSALHSEKVVIFDEAQLTAPISM